LSANYELCLELSGLYIHIPFCRKACTYCNFHFTTGQRYKEDFVQFLKKEYDSYLPQWQDPWETVYFGGGTPSLLPAAQLGELLDHVRKTRGIDSDAEITLEANPEDISEINISRWKSIGINRISLGVQSLSDIELKAMNRAHLAATSIAAIEMLVQSKFHSVNLDLIYGSPWLSDEDWTETLAWAFSCGAQHISAYALTAEPDTRFWKDINSGKSPDLDEDKQARHFEMLQDAATQHCWHHYEISNLCKPGFEAKHNSNYWNNKPYLGIGPSAHSFDGKRNRRWNVSDNQRYVAALEAGILAYEEEQLSNIDLLNEFIITRLRLSIGFNTNEILHLNPDWKRLKQAVILELSEKKHILMEGDQIYLTAEGRLFSDAISRNLML